jgi:two-component system chemotaxis response regulator CheB
MGKDGAEELRLMKERGAVTMAQDEESSIVYGMPGEANRLNAATFILPPDSIIDVLKSMVYQKRI